MDKTIVFAAVLARLEEEMGLRRQAAGQARREATDEQVKSENKYDTRSTEASYLARGHALSIEALESELVTLRGLSDPGRLVELLFSGKSEWVYLLPCGGGRTVEIAGHTITVVTPETALGQKLQTLRQGDLFPLPPGLPPGRVNWVG